MVAAGHNRSIYWGALSGLMAFVFIQTPSTHTAGKERAGSSSINRQDSSRFIVAFELSPGKNPSFTWPIEPTRPAPYESVLMVVEKMPRVLDQTGRNGRSRPLFASRHLKINGRLQRPLRASTAQVNGRETFLVRLAQGWLNLELTIPAGTRPDPQHKTARIKLYEAATRADPSQRTRLSH
jgi:hypothetical protein